MEKILCAAIKRKTRRICDSEPYHQNDILDIEIGYRHHDIIMRFTGEIDPFYQGFYTSMGRYVDREEGFKIAEKANQIMRITGSYGTLFSEDLY
jgi:hypothetical protein